MTNERQFHRQARIDYFYKASIESSAEFKGRVDSERTGHGMKGEGKQKDPSVTKLPLEPVIKMLDSLRLSPREARRVLSNNGFVFMPDYGAKMGTNDSLKTESQRFEDYKPLSMSGTGSTLGISHESPRNPAVEDCMDACSESTFSQSSELSQTSDVPSINTTSSDSDNHHIYEQIVRADADRRPNRYNTITVRTSSGFIVDLDVEVTKTVIMLMKIILWLRQRYPNSRAVYYRQRTLDPIRETRISPFAESSSDSESSSSQGMVINLKPKRKRISFSPVTLLFSAVTDKSFLEAKEILETNNDIDVNQQTPSGQSLLHIAAGNADLKCVRLLLEYGADCNIKDAAGWGPLHSAVRRGYWKCAILLIEAGSNFAEYSQRRIMEYKEVLHRSRNCYRSMEIFV